MSEAKDIELLVEISRLLKKYGPKTFEDLAKKLTEGQLLDTLVSILDASAQSGRQSKKKLGTKHTTSRKSTGINELISLIETEDPEKAEVLKHLYEKLVAKSILLSLRDIRHFAEDNGLQSVKATSRDKAIVPFLRDIASIPLDRIVNIFSKVSHREESGERTLEGWAEVILGSKNKKTKGT